jgi:hypothetical protein
MSIPKSQTTEDPQFKAGFVIGFCGKATEYALQQARGQFLSPKEKADALKLFDMPLREIAERVYNTRDLKPGAKRFNALLAGKAVG